MDTAPFASLVTENKIPVVVKGIEDAVVSSFDTDIIRLASPTRLVGYMTHDEMKRRAQMCIKIFRELRGDLKWTVEKIVDHLPEYLRCELDGKPWKPSESTHWTPQG